MAQFAIELESSPRAGHNFKEIVTKWTDEALHKNLAVYERLVEVHSGKALPWLNKLTKKLVYHEPMPWMLPAYESGLNLIKEEIKRRSK